MKAFFVDTLASALALGVATTDDILRHATPDVLSIHLPRPLWARLIAACLGAPRVDSRLVVETIGLPNLAEHVPGSILWACIYEFGQRAFGADWKPAAAAPIATPVAKSAPLSTPPPPDEIAKPAPVIATARNAHPTIPTPELVEVEEAPAPPTIPSSATAAPSSPRARPPVQQRFRQSSTGIGRLAPTNPTARKPQATTTAVTAPPAPPPRRSTDSEDDVMTEVGGKDDWKNALAVEDEQLVDWTASDEGTNVDELGRRK
ncbi:MAG TPA: hypothetical protein VGM88_30230 [Kofleriaceae bacterium]